MPSIKQSELDELKQRAEDAASEALQARRDASVAERSVSRFDRILEKIDRAACGAPLIEVRNSLGSASWPNGSYSGSNFYGLTPDPNAKPSKAERREREVTNLNDRIVELERRLAAVKAVAVFAKEHKA